MFTNKNFLITGATGYFGKKFILRLLSKYKPKKLIIFSRDETKQYEMQNDKIFKKYLKILRFFIGDVRDVERLKLAMRNIDFVVHAAALKHVPSAEYNPTECIRTNIYGAENVIKASLECNVKKVIALSTDKAANPINIYGATKLASDKLFVAANNLSGLKGPKFSVVRYGNVFASRGSVVPFFLNLKKNDSIPITDLDMTRFNISLDDAVKFVLWSLENNLGGEILIPKMPSYKITDLAKSIKSNSKFKIVGIRPGEKLYEELISKFDSFNTYDLKNCYSIIEDNNEYLKKFYHKKKFKKVRKLFEYNSSNNKAFLNKNELKTLVENFKKKKVLSSN